MKNSNFEHEFFKMISKYNTKMLCRKFAEINLLVYKRKIETGKRFEVDLKEFGLDKYFRQRFLTISHWTIRDIILMICRRPKFDDKKYIRTSITENEILQIIGRFLDYENSTESEKIDPMTSTKLNYMLYGIGLQQFPSQTSNTLYNTIRNHVIFNKTNNLKNKLLDIETPFFNKFGASYSEYIAIIMIIYAKMNQGVYIFEGIELTIEEWTNKIDDFKNKFGKVIDSLSMNYTKLENQDLHESRYRFPIINDTEEFYVIDPFILERKLYEGSYWIVRDYYYKSNISNDKNYFPNNFGILFEKYVEILLDKVLEFTDSINYVKLTESNKNDYFDKDGTDNQYVDFIIETFNYQIVIECKSAIQMISASDTYNNYQAVEYFYQRNVLEACIQLKKTGEKLVDTDKKRLNVVLIYQESFNKNHTKDIFFEGKNIYEYNDFLVVDIVEFEKFLKVFCEDSNKAEIIFNSFLSTNMEHDISKGRDLDYHITHNNCSHLSMVKEFESELRCVIHSFG